MPGQPRRPLYNVFKRFFEHLDNYRRYISNDLEPTVIDEEIAISWINTARVAHVQRRAHNEERVERIRTKLCPSVRDSEEDRRHASPVRPAAQLG